MLAHGGTAGAVGETLFVLIPIAVFGMLSRRARLQRERDEAAESGDDADTDPETTPS